VRPENPEEWETYGNIEVTWTRAASSRIDGYHVFRSEVNEPYEQIAEATDTSFVDSELGTGWQYQYQVRPFTRAEGDLASLGTASATTPLPEPFVTTVALCDSSLEIDLDSDVYVGQFKVEWAPENEPFTAANSRLIQPKEYGGIAVEFYGDTTVTGLGLSLQYRVRVTAMTGFASSETELDRVVLIPPPDEVTSTPLEDGTVKIDWKSDSARVTGYRVAWTEDFYAADAVVQSVVVGKDARSAILRDLKEGVDYSVRVYAVAGELESDMEETIYTHSFEPFDPSPTPEADPVVTDNKDIVSELPAPQHPVTTDINESNRVAPAPAPIAKPIQNTESADRSSTLLDNQSSKIFDDGKEDLSAFYYRITE
jgi:hypothetical protein